MCGVWREREGGREGGSSRERKKERRGREREREMYYHDSSLECVRAPCLVGGLEHSLESNEITS